MTFTPLAGLHRLVWMALLAALLAAGANLAIPVGPVPITLQTLFVYLAGFLLGPRLGPLAVVLYLLAGFMGLPVFAGGKSGLAVLTGPTAGYLVGFVLAAAITGLGRRHGRPPETVLSWRRGLGCVVLAEAVIFLCGVGWLGHKLQVDWLKALSVGLLPFLPGDLIKASLAVTIVRYLGRRRLLPS